MIVEYRNAKLRKYCTDYDEACRKYGARNAELLQLRVSQLTAAASAQEMVAYRIGRCHALQGRRAGQYALDLDHPLRLVFIPRADGSVQVAAIWEIVDYHGKG